MTDPDSPITTHQGVFQGFAGINVFYKISQLLEEPTTSVVVIDHCGGDCAGR